MTDRRVVVVTGGWRSGKSAFARTLARQSGRPVVFIRTQEDAAREWQPAIAPDVARVPGDWTVISAPLHLRAAVHAAWRIAPVVVVDDLACWATNWVGGASGAPASSDRHARLRRLAAALTWEIDAVLRDVPSDGWLVLETRDPTWDDAPDGLAARAGGDLLARLNQRVALQATQVYTRIAAPSRAARPDVAAPIVSPPAAGDGAARPSASDATTTASLPASPPGLGRAGRSVSLSPHALSGAIGALALAMVVALLAQRALVPHLAFRVAIVGYALAVALCLAAVAYLDAVCSLPDRILGSPAGRVWNWPRDGRGRRWLAGGVLAAGACLLLAAIVSLATTGTSAVALPLWLLALLAIAVSAMLWTSFPWKLLSARAGALEYTAVATILLVAFVFRFADVTGIPIDVHGDEAAVGNEARQILSGGITNVFGLGWAGLPDLSFVASALTLKLFGNNLFGLRMASVLQGTLSVALLYGVARRLFSVRIAVLSATVLAVAQMAVHFSRTGNNYIQALMVSLLLAYLLVRALSTGHPVDFLLAGYATGGAVTVYLAARLTPVLLALYCLHRALTEHDFFRRQWRGLVVVAVGACIFVAPQLVVYAQHPQRLVERTSAVFAFTRDSLAHEYDADKVHSVQGVLGHQAVNTLDAFNYRGETGDQYGQRGPLLDFWTAALLVLGAALVTVRVSQARYFLLASWLWLTLLLGSVLTLDALFSPHIVAALGVLAILPVLPLDACWRAVAVRFGAIGHRTFTGVAILFAVVVTGANGIDYFHTHVQTMEPPSFFTVLSRYILTVNDHYRVYLVSDADTSLQYDTVRFLVPDIDGVDVRDRPLPLPLDRLPAEKGVAFLVRSPTDPRLARLKAAYPDGAITVVRGARGFPEFTSYQVEHGALVTADPHATIDHAPIPGLEITQLTPK